MGVTDSALACESEPVMDAVCTAVVGPARTGPVLARTNLLMQVVLARTR